MSKIRVIINPNAQSYSTSIESRLFGFLTEEGLDFELVKTTGPGHATDLAKAAVGDGIEVVIAVGGNGTCNEAINGLMQASANGMAGTLGIIPVGCGNEFARAVGIPLTLKEACHKLAHGQVKLLDVGRVTLPNGQTRFFGNTVGIGFDGRIALDAETTRWFRGTLMSTWMTIKAVAVYNQAPVMNVSYNGQIIEQPMLMVVIGNGQCEASVFQVTPWAKLDDGLFDLLLVPEVSRLQLLRLIPSFKKGTQAVNGTRVVDNPIVLARTPKVQVSSEAELIAHIDGDSLCTDAHQLKFDIFPQSLKVLC